MPAVNGVGKPCAGEPHARFDGRELETEPRSDHGHAEERPHGKPRGHSRLRALPLITVTAPAPDPPVRYTPSDVFETFALPKLTDELRQLGGELDTYRRDLMLSRNSGLTKIYNLVFDPECHDDDIEELRRIHRDIDAAAVRAYGWEYRIGAVGGLDHGFHKVARETRYTIGPASQREILDSLLELNHENYAEEVAQGLHDTKGKRNGGAEQGTLL